jgi:hypothetical protein
MTNILSRILNGLGFCLISIILGIFIGYIVDIIKGVSRRRDDAEVFIDVFRNDIQLEDFEAFHFNIPEGQVRNMMQGGAGIWHAEIIGEGVDIHDHTVQNSLTSSFKALKTWYDKSKAREEVPSPKWRDGGMSSIKSAVFSCKLDINIIEKAYSTLRSIEKINSNISSIDTDELTVLHIVWARINDPINAAVRNDLLENLVHQLADAAVNLDMSRCASGRVTRIIHALEAIDTENIISITSTESIRRELNNKVPILISKYEGKHNIIDLIDKELRADYVETKLLTDEIYDSLTKEYFEAVDDYRTSESQTGHLVENVVNQSEIHSR